MSKIAAAKKGMKYLISLAREKEKIFFVAKLIIAAGLLIYIFQKIGSVKIFSVVANANLFVIGIVIVLGALNIFLQFHKWKIMCRNTIGIKNNRKILRSLFYGFAGGAFTPARVGEFVARGLAFKERSLLEISAATIIDKLFNLLIILSIGAVSIISFIHIYLSGDPFITLSLFIFVFSLIFLMGNFITTEEFWDSFIFKRLARVKFLSKYIERLSLLKNLDSATLSSMLGYSFLFYVTFLLQYALLVMAFVPEWNVLTFLWAGTLMFFVKSLIPSISFGELGIREAASIFFLSYFGLTEEIGFNSAFILFFINILIPALFGLGLLFKRGK